MTGGNTSFPAIGARITTVCQNEESIDAIGIWGWVSWYGQWLKIY
jgi:hypothetical protein